jgi:hypothetical protein
MYLDMINFYRRFIPGAAETFQPLNDLLKGLTKEQRVHRVVNTNRKRLPRVETRPHERHDISASDTWLADQPRGRRI